MAETAALQTPRKITVDDVVAVGVEVTAARGLPALTLRAVADRLGVRTPSLYYHLPGGIEELQSRVVARIQELLDDDSGPPLGADASVWERLEQPLRQVGRSSLLYPGVLEHLLTKGKDSAPTLKGADRTVLLLLESELKEAAPEAFVAIHAYVTGWVFARRPSSDAAREEGMGSLADVLQAADGLDNERVLFDGLRALLAGLLLTRDQVAIAQEADREPKAPERTLRRFLR